MNRKPDRILQHGIVNKQVQTMRVEYPDGAPAATISTTRVDKEGNATTVYHYRRGRVVCSCCPAITIDGVLLTRAGGAS